MRNLRSQSGFTLMEILVAMTIFVTTVVLVLSLLSYTLKINRRVQSLRQVAQGTRNFTEILTREIRNGRIDYNTPDSSECPDPAVDGQYASPYSSHLGLINLSGERLCLYSVGNSNTPQEIYLSKTTPTGTTRESIMPTNFRIQPNSLRFAVRPVRDPNVVPYPGMQPFVSVLVVFQVQTSPSEPIITIPYQTTISTDAYDTLHR